MEPFEVESVAALRRHGHVRRPTAIGSIATIISGTLTIAWTYSLARCLVALVESGPIAGWTIALTMLTLLRVITDRIATMSWTRAADATCRIVRREVVDGLIASGGAPDGSSATTIAGPMVDDLGPWTASYLPARLAATVIPLAAAALITILDPLSALVLAFSGPMLVALLALIGRATRDRADRRLRELEWLRELTLDMVRGIPTLRVFGRVDDGAESIRGSSERFTVATMDVLRSAFQTSLVIEWAATAATALVAVEVGLRLVDGDLTFTTALVVLVLTPEFFVPLRRLASEYHAGRAGDAAIARIDAVLAVPAPTDATGTDRTDRRHGAPGIEFRSVDIAPDGHRPRLDGIDLSIASGETVAIMGPSGSGKSTLASVLTGTIRATAGVVHIDGVPLDRLDLGAWRQRLSIVTQRPFLLPGSIAENIAISVPTATRTDIERVARLALVDEFATALPDGLDTRIGIDGARLSGGQRQRIAIARALLRDADLVVLDEFTAHLDPAIEAEVIDVMRRHVRDRTAIVITHRPATLVLADRTIELVDGSIVDAGVTGSGRDDHGAHR